MTTHARIAAVALLGLVSAGAWTAALSPAHSASIDEPTLRQPPGTVFGLPQTPATRAVR